MDRSQHVTQSKSPAVPKPALPAKPAPLGEPTRSERPAGSPPRSATPWMAATGLAVLFVLVLTVVCVILLSRSQGRVAEAQAVAEAERRRTEAAAADERQRAAFAEGQLEIVKREVEQLRKNVNDARGEAEEARRQLRTAEDNARQRQTSLESELQAARRAQNQPRVPPTGESDELLRLKKELALARRESDDLKQQLAEVAGKLPAPTAPPGPANPNAKVLDDPGNLSDYSDQIGKEFYFRVTGDRNGSISGRDAYTIDSPLATTAVHSGAVKHGQTAVVRVIITKGSRYYPGSTRNGVTSIPWNEAYPASYRVYRKE